MEGKNTNVIEKLILMELYLVSGDYISFEKPIKIIKWEKIIVLGRKCLWVSLEKTIDYAEFGIPVPVSKYILLDRFYYNRIHKLDKFPIEVHVFIPKDENNPFEGFNKWGELFNAAWASLYDSYETALANEG